MLFPDEWNVIRHAETNEIVGFTDEFDPTKRPESMSKAEWIEIRFAYDKHMLQLKLNMESNVSPPGSDAYETHNGVAVHKDKDNATNGTKERKPSNRGTNAGTNKRGTNGRFVRSS